MDPRLSLRKTLALVPVLEAKRTCPMWRWANSPGFQQVFGLGIRAFRLALFLGAVARSLGPRHPPLVPRTPPKLRSLARQRVPTTLRAEAVPQQASTLLDGILVEVPAEYIKTPSSLT